MKVDKSNPKHWLYLTLFGLNTLIAIGLRPLGRAKRKNSDPIHIILYGHRLSGNLLALHRHISKHHNNAFNLTFLTMDPAYHQALLDEGVTACRASHPSTIQVLCKADAIISDHGLHSMAPLLWLSDVKFFDVWHGIPFKGFDEHDFKIQHRYTEAWVASPLMAELYLSKFGFPQEKIRVTGYARTDNLVIPQETDDEILKRFELQHTRGKRLVLFAPTWKQDKNDRTLFPFSVEPETFLRDISSLCRKHDAVPVMRTHINAQVPDTLPQKNIEFRPFGEFPDTEGLLQVTDILICDWSSIAFDFLLLDRPTIFLDVPAPFKKRYSLGPDYRFGEITENYEDFLQRLSYILTNHDRAQSALSNRYARAKQAIYGDYADGKSAERCLQRVKLNLK